MDISIKISTFNREEKRRSRNEEDKQRSKIIDRAPARVGRQRERLDIHGEANKINQQINIRSGRMDGESLSIQQYTDSAKLSQY